MGYNPLLLVDSYKIHHYPMYPDNMTKLYSNGTCRKSRFPNIQNVVVFGIQHFTLKYLIEAFDKDFFLKPFHRNPTEKIVLLRDYARHCQVDTAHIEALWDLGYLPIELKALDEGTLCPIGVPMLTITNTHPDFGWLVNYLETLISCSLWQSYTSATLGWEFRKLLTKHAIKTTGTGEGVQWQGHDFSMRGMSSVESAILSGMGHLLSFTGTDTIPAIYQLEDSYNATGLIGASVPATEHSVMCMGTKESEIETFRRLIKLYPTGILSIVSDTWDLWKVCTEYLSELKDEILARDGKIVIRPDSGDPVDIICGLNIAPGQYYWDKETADQLINELALKGYDAVNFKDHELHRIWKDSSVGYVSGYSDLKGVSTKGVVELLWDIFGGTEVQGADGKMYKVLDIHIGAIYGDSINLERAEQICERLAAKGFASTNVVLGIGSYTYQYNTRDTFGFAMKATYGEITHKVFNGKEESTQVEAREIFKDPITDDGTKKSKKGLLVVEDNFMMDRLPAVAPKLVCRDQQTWEQEATGLLTTVFKDGVLIKNDSLDTIRERLLKNL